jgi:hypothetical protein
MVRVQFPAEERYFSFLNGVQTGSGDHPVSYPMGTRDCFLCDKAAME